jgi:hypothetical protein
MKKTLLFLVMLCCYFQSSAQDLLVGRKVLNASLYVDIFEDNASVSTTVLIGKIRPSLSYWAFGGQFQLAKVGQSSAIGIGPAVEHGKFVKIIDKFYFAPYFGGSLTGFFRDSGDTGSLLLGVYAVPTRFMYQFSERFLLNASFGSANLTTGVVNDAFLLKLSSAWTNNSSFGVFYTFK